MEQITFDTNIFLHNLDIIGNYEEYEKVVLLPVIAELDNIKVNSQNGMLKHKGRMATRKLIKMIKEGEIKPLISDFSDNDKIDKEVRPLNKYELIDDLIIFLCKEKGIKLVTMDFNVVLKCEHVGVEVELIKDEMKIENLSMVYKGVQEIYTTKTNVDMLFKGKGINVDLLCQDVHFNENECVTLINSENPNCKVMSIHKDGVLRQIPFSDKTYWGLSPRSLEQRYALALLDDDDIKIVTLTGEAGNSKSILSFAVGLEKNVNGNRKGKLYIAKPPVSLSKKLALGFKKGTTIDKAMGSLGSYSTNLERLSSHDDGRNDGRKMLESLMEQCKVVYLNLEDILGMSFSPNDYIIIDEAELLTKDEMKAILTRGGKMVVIGDCDQKSENSGVDYENSGLLHLIEIGKQSKLIAHLTLEQTYREGAVAEINEIW